MNWQLSISFHWPHDRFCIGWQVIKPSDEDNYWTFTLYLAIATLDLDVDK